MTSEEDATATFLSQHNNGDIAANNSDPLLLESLSVTSSIFNNNSTAKIMPASSNIVELNVGGVYYTSTLQTLLSETDSYFTAKFADPSPTTLLRDSKNKVFIDRDGLLFRYVLDYLRAASISTARVLSLPENFNEKRRLRSEAEYFKLSIMVKLLDDLIASTSTSATSTTSIQNQAAVATAGISLERQGSFVSYMEGGRPSSALSSVSMSAMSGGGGSGNGGQTVQLPPIYASNTSTVAVSQVQPVLNRVNRKQTLTQPMVTGGCIVIGYRGTFSNGRDGMNDVKFRKISRILVCGRVQLCREVFGETLNESRDPDHGVSDRYTSRYYLKHTFLEQAFDTLCDAGFALACVGATGANSCPTPMNDKDKNLNDNEENRWLHYNEFVFIRCINEFRA